MATATGFTTKTIRYYEREGLLADPGRTGSGYREYTLADVERLGFIGKAKRLGLSLAEIKGILQVYERNEPTCEHVRSLVDEKLAYVDALLKDLSTFREEMSRLRQRTGRLVDCRPTGGGICGIVENSGFGGSEKALRLLQSSGRKA
ncbi:MAG: heavy metal-responsive transcriptional regulator [Chloroflexi bacterium]|nr:heavy metal-responsive transcriptional regulator [Chloroflexota bacterium]